MYDKKKKICPTDFTFHMTCMLVRSSSYVVITYDDEIS